MNQSINPDEMLNDPPFWLFEVSSNGEPLSRIFGPENKRHWVFWNLSKHILEHEKSGVITVTRFINGKWEKANDWRKLAH